MSQQLPCVRCGQTARVGITGLCPACWPVYLEDHDLRMRTIHRRETGELLPPGTFGRARAGRGLLELEVAAG